MQGPSHPALLRAKGLVNASLTRQWVVGTLCEAGAWLPRSGALTDSPHSCSPTQSATPR